MYNTNLTFTEVNKIWKVLITVLSLTFAWHTYSVYAFSGLTSQFNQIVHHAPPSMATNMPDEDKKQNIEAAYQRAKYFTIVQTNDRINYSKSDLLCLAKNIYHEAGNQSAKGKLAVAQVTINRTRDSAFSGSICDVVMAKNQFSWTLNHKLRWSSPKGKMWEDSMKVAKQSLAMGIRVKGMENALFYHADYVRPRWNHVERLAQIGAHIFYERV